MNASKEECQHAKDRLMSMSDGLSQELRNRFSANIIQIQEFLDAAKRKLPSEAAFAKDKQRRKTA